MSLLTHGEIKVEQYVLIPRRKLGLKLYHLIERVPKNTISPLIFHVGVVLIKFQIRFLAATCISSFMCFVLSSIVIKKKWGITANISNLVSRSIIFFVVHLLRAYELTKQSMHYFTLHQQLDSSFKLNIDTSKNQIYRWHARVLQIVIQTKPTCRCVDLRFDFITISSKLSLTHFHPSNIKCLRKICT